MTAAQTTFGKRKSDRGFTLVEVIVVLVILAILAGIMIPALTGWIDKAKSSSVLVDARTAYTAAQTIASEKYGLGYSGTGGVNYGLFSNRAGGQRYKYTAVFSSSESGAVGYNISSAKEMAELADISGAYVCWVHFKENVGVDIDAIIFEQDGYAAYYDMTNSSWTVVEDPANQLKQVDAPDFKGVARLLFGSSVNIP